MSYEIFGEVTNQAIKLVLLISAPMLIAALVMGILISIFQAVTQINEQTLSFIPKIVVIFGAMVIFAPWMSETITNFTTELILSIPSIIAQQ